MKVSLKLPRLSANMEEAVIVKWHRAPGDQFAPGDPLYEVETEKVTSLVEAPCGGKLLEVFPEHEDVVTVGQEICLIEKTGP